MRNNRLRILALSAGFCLILSLLATTFVPTVDMSNVANIIDESKSDLHDVMTPTQDSELNVWHHDCSDIAAFDGLCDDTWLWDTQPALRTTFGSIESSGQYFFSSDLGPPPDERSWFGPMYYHTLATPFYFEDFVSFQCSFEIDPLGDAGKTGGVMVALHDDSNRTVVQLAVRDPFMGSSNVYASGSWFFSNDTIVVPTGSPATPPYSETTVISQDSTGLYTILPRCGSFKLLDSTEVENRLVKYISVRIAGSKEASQDPWPYTDIVRLWDITLKHYPDSEANVWHHDCSNIADFTYIGDESWALREELYNHSVVGGTLESSGSYIYPTQMESGDDWHGPLYYYRLTNPVKLSHFLELRATIEIGSSSISQLARMNVVLNDEDGIPIAGASVIDGWSGEESTLPEAYWMFRDRSFIRTTPGTPSRIFDTYKETLRIWQNSTGVYVELPRIGEYKVLDSHMIDTSRVITYVTIHAMKFRTLPACEVMRVHDIQMRYLSYDEPWSLKLSGNFDYPYKEPIPIQIAALLTHAETGDPISDAYIELRFYDPNSNLLSIENMTEVEPGVYVYRSPETIEYYLKEGIWQKGVYLVVGEASMYAGSSIQARDLLQYHIDPPGGQGPDPLLLFAVIGFGGLALVDSVLVGHYFWRRRRRIELR